MEPIAAAIAIALAQGPVQVGGKLLEKGVVEPALEPATGGVGQRCRDHKLWPGIDCYTSLLRKPTGNPS